MNTLATTLKGKLFGKIPVWLVLVFVVGGAVYVINKRSKAATQDTTGGDLAQAGSALDTGDLANGLPTTQNYVFVNVPGETTPAPSTTPTGGVPLPPNHNPGPLPPTGPGPRNPVPGKTNSITYKVQGGDTLYGISAKESKALGHKVTESAIYTANKSVIESTAKAHGYKSSDNGHWIFPGEKLVIPA